MRRERGVLRPRALQLARLAGTLRSAQSSPPSFHAQEVITFLRTCGEENLQFLLHPPRLKKALEVLDEDGSGEIDIEEWRVLRRPL